MYLGYLNIVHFQNYQQLLYKPIFEVYQKVYDMKKPHRSLPRDWRVKEYRIFFSEKLL